MFTGTAYTYQNVRINKIKLIISFIMMYDFASDKLLRV